MKTNLVTTFTISILLCLSTTTASLMSPKLQSPTSMAKKNKRISEMGNIMFKALQSVLIEKKMKDLTNLKSKERNLLETEKEQTTSPSERNLRGNKLTKTVQKLIRDEYRSKMYNRKHHFAYNRNLNGNESGEPIFRPVYMSDYPRISTVVSTANTIINLQSNVMKDATDENESMDLKEIFSAASSGLQIYRQIRNFINIVFIEHAELSLEIDSFYYHCDKILISKEEMLNLLSLEKYYTNAKKKCDVTSERFRELDNELQYQANDFVDKVRRFLLGIDNLRNVGSYMGFEASQTDINETNKNWDQMNTLEKIKSGENMTELILTLKMKLENMMFGIRDGIHKSATFKKDIVVILREMYKLIPLKNEGVNILRNLTYAFVMLVFFLKKE